MTIRQAIAVLIVGAGAMHAGITATAQDSPAARSALATEARTMQAEFVDDGELRIVLDDDKLVLDSPYGKLSIPVEEIRRIEFATRLSDRDTKRIEAAIFNLGSSDFTLRENATRELLALREKGYPALIKANKHADLEVAQRAQEVVVKLRDMVPTEKLVIRELDVVETVHSKIAGRIVEASLRVQTSQFGKQDMQLTDVRSLVSLLAAPAEVDPINVDADPGNLLSYHDQIGKSFAFKVTGRVAGSVYGTITYTTDSNLATAAVHSGALKVGETGIVRVTMVPSPATFASSSQNGVISSAWGSYPAAYQIQLPKK